MQKATNDSNNAVNVRTVEEEIYKAIKRRTVCAGRTDKDVSALSQAQELPLTFLLKCFNGCGLGTELYGNHRCGSFQDSG